MGKRLEQILHRKRISNKHMKKIPNTISHQGNQIKTTVRYSYSPTRMAKRIDSSKCWQGCGAPGTLIPCKLTCPLTSRGVWPKGGTGRTLKCGWRMLWSLPAALPWGLSGGPLATALVPQ